MWRKHLLNANRAAILLSLAAVTCSVRAADANAPVKAVWQVQEIYLSYFGFTTYYSCEGLRDKVRSMVLQLGASEGLVVTAAGCTELTGPERIPGVRIIVATPHEATSEMIAANAKDSKRAALIAKLQRKGQPELESGEFDATRKIVALNIKDPHSASGAGDCELVEHIRDQVIKKIDAKVVKDELGCIPHQGTVGNRKLQVEVLVKA